MKLTVLCLSSFILFGCTSINDCCHLSTQEIVDQAEICRKHKLEPMFLGERNRCGSCVQYVQCEPEQQ